MENKYFTPDIEDIRIGYECELFLPIKDWFKPEKWKRFKISKNGYNRIGPYGGDLSELDEVCNLVSLYQARTPYLTKEQIEAEGWIDGKKDNYKLLASTVTYDDRIEYPLHIMKGDMTIFYGDCKDINTFRYILKLLKITNEKSNN